MQRLNLLKYFILTYPWLRCCASISFTNQNYDGIQVGIPFALTWEGAQGAVTLGLLFKMNASSPQNITIIGTDIIDSIYPWTPPGWTADVFAQKIEAQDTNNNFASTSNFTIKRAASVATSAQPNKIAADPTLSPSSTFKNADSQSTSSTSPSSKLTEQSRSGPSSATRARIGLGISIVVVLVMIGVALIFFEHGKRVAARTEQCQHCKFPFERSEQGTMGLELAERHRSDQKKDATEMNEEEPSTPLLYKKPRLPAEPSAGVIGDSKMTISSLEEEEERRKKILSVRSIYELA